MATLPPLSSLTTLGVGGPPRRFVRAKDGDAVATALRDAQDVGLPVLLLGGGSNLLVSDSGFPGLVLQLADDSIRLGENDGSLEIEAAAGCSWDRLVERSVAAGRAALAPLSGIPGSCGAAPMQNIGAYGVELSEHLDSVELLDRHSLASFRMSAAELELGYRESRLKSRDAGRFVVLSIRLRLRGDEEFPLRYAELQRRFEQEALPRTADALRQLVLRIRRGKSMVLDRDDPHSRSAGSFFTNPLVTARQARELAERFEDQMPRWEMEDGRVKLSAAWCIERAGFRRGERRGAAALSAKHVLALCNPEGTATAAQLLSFAREIHDRVLRELGVTLDPEPRLIGFRDEELGPFRHQTR